MSEDKIKRLTFIRLHEFAKRLLHKILTKFRERQFKSVKYLFFSCKSSDKLVVVFSSFVPSNSPPRYHYLKALATARVNRLFILDQYGDKRKIGTYTHSRQKLHFIKKMYFLVYK